MNRRTRLTFLAVVLTLAACGGDGDETSPLPSTTPTTQRARAGPQAFLSFARSASFGSKDLSTATDDQLLGIGNVVCDGLGNGLTFGQVVQGVVGSDAHPSTAEAEEFARQAVSNLCPQYASQVP